MRKILILITKYFAITIPIGIFFISNFGNLVDIILCFTSVYFGLLFIED